MKNKGRIFLVDDDELIVATLSRALRNIGYDVATATRAEGIVNKIKSWLPVVVLLDIRLAGRSGIDVLKEIIRDELPAQVVMLTADGTAETAVNAMKLGAADYITKPFDIDEVKIVLENIIEKENLKQEVVYLRNAQSEVFEKEIIGRSTAVQKIKSKIEKMAGASISTILITGESGTGKELFAQYAHRLLHQKGEEGFSPFVKVNCAALPETLLESELFGHLKGSFTDAKADKKGLFELGNGGSILLDEIGDMQQSLQGKLLRVLEERKVRPIGGEEEVPIDVTVIATTNVDIAGAVAKGNFRMDLLYRLNAFYLQVPPLRERQEDILLLAEYYLSYYARQFNKKTIKRFSPEVVQLMQAYDWPGNIRELRNLVERLVVLETEEVILPRHLAQSLTAQSEALHPLPNGLFRLPAAGISLEAVERDLIEQALERSNYNKTQAAKLLQISYDTLRYQVKKFKLE